MGFIGMTAAIMNNVLREAKKTKVCRCPNCKNIIKRYLPDTLTEEQYMQRFFKDIR